MLDRITFLTIGQTPRTDLVPEIVESFPRHVEVRELGALDGLDPDEIERLRPASGERALLTRLRDGGQAVLGKRWVTRRIQELLDASKPGASHATVLLCTGDFPALRGPPLFFDAQHLVDGGVSALHHTASSVGLLVPLERQEGAHHYRPPAGRKLRTAPASPYEDADFEAVGRALADCDLIVMHCMGYTEAQRGAVMRGSERPVLLARRLVAGALSQLW